MTTPLPTAPFFRFREMSVQIGNWHFDIFTSIVTTIAIPMFWLMLGIAKRNILPATSFLMNALVYHVAAPFTKAATARLTLRAYSRIQLAGSSKYLHIPSYRNVALEIDKIFVPLALERTGAHESATHVSMTSAGNRIQIIGDPGSGKSTIIKRIFRDECNRALNNTSRAKLPILLELRRLNIPKSIQITQLGTWMLELIKKEAEKIHAYRVDTCFDAYVQTTGVLLLLDGLDEVNTENFDRIQNAIRALGIELANRSPNNVVICTMRVQFYQQVKQIITDIFPVLFSIRPFSPTDIYAFLCQWEFGRPTDPAAERMRLFNDLADRPSLREMCSNPLILSMYVAQDQTEGGISAPESRTDFYAKVVEELVIRRRLSQLGPAHAQTVLKNQRMTILGRIAHEHLVGTIGPTNFLVWADVISVISDVMKIDTEQAEIHLRELSKETGIISEEREREACRFIHLTFCEFLAAYQAVHGSASGWVDLISRHEALLAQPSSALHTRLVEVIPFACALLPRHQMPDAVASIARTSDRRTLTLAFLETKIYDDPIWYEFAVAREADLLEDLNGLENSEDAHRRWLDDVVLFVVLCRDEERARRFLSQDRPIYNVDQLFRKLSSRAKSLILPMIAIYAAHDAVAASRVAALCQVNLEDEAPEVLIDACDQPPLIALLVDQTQNDARRVASVARLLAEAGLRSPAARAALLSATGWGSVLRLASEVPVKERWFRPPYIPATLFSACVTIAVEQHRQRPMAFEKGISLIAEIPPVRVLAKLRFWRLALLAIGAMLYLTSGIGIALMEIWRRQNEGWQTWADPLAYLYQHRSLTAFFDKYVGVATPGVIFGIAFAAICISASLGMVYLARDVDWLISRYLMLLGVERRSIHESDNARPTSGVVGRSIRRWGMVALPPPRGRLASRFFLTSRARKSLDKLRAGLFDVGAAGSAFLSSADRR